MSSITTKVGDKGNTRLWSGEEVRKTDPRVVFCGHIDELVTLLGGAYAHINPCYEVRNALKDVQKELFIVASEVATTKPKYYKLKDKITSKHVRELTKAAKSIEDYIELPKGFILPGASVESYQVDLARVKVRSCERGYVKLFDDGIVDNENIIVWLNRLSDYLYLVARYLENNCYNLVKEN